MTYPHSQKHTSIIRPTTHPEGSPEPSETKKTGTNQHETRISENYEEGRVANEQPAPSHPDLLLAALGCAAHDPAGVPEALRGRRQWMGTRFEPRKGQPGKFDKPPYRVVEGQSIIKADKTDPANWSTYDEALYAHERGAVDAIGYVLMPDDPFYVADFDDVLDPETGQIDAMAAQEIHAMYSYAERSISGKGVHVFAEGKKPQFAGCKSSALGFSVEVYDARRFIVVSGQPLAYTPREVQHRQRELSELCGRLWPKQHKLAQGPRRSHPLDITDEQLLARARRARTGRKFRALYDQGDRSGYTSPSEADYDLLDMLCFWCAGDEQRMVRLFESSALYREEKHRTYVQGSARKKMTEYVGKFYSPRRVADVGSSAGAKLPKKRSYPNRIHSPRSWPHFTSRPYGVGRGARRLTRRFAPPCCGLPRTAS
jgi:hypothetical protein